MKLLALSSLLLLCMTMQISTVTPTPGSGEDDPVSERKYKENFYASVSIMSNKFSVIRLVFTAGV